MLSAVDKYCGDHYGVLLYNLFEDSAEKYVRCWGTLTKLCWNVPRGTHRYFVPNLLSAGFSSIRTNVILRYISFYRKLLKSRSAEVALVASLAGRDLSSTTGINMAKIQAETGLNPFTARPKAVRHVLEEKEATVPTADLWRIPLLVKLLRQRADMDVNGEKLDAINNLIDSLCIS